MKHWASKVVVFLVALGAIGMQGVLSGPAQAATTSETCFLDGLNAARAGAGVAGLPSNATLVTLAEVWSQTMATAGTIWENPNLAVMAPANWLLLGENVGMGPSCDSIEAALIASPPHLANILNSAFTSVGVGVAVSASGTMFVTEVFMASGSPTQVATPAPVAVRQAPAVVHVPVAVAKTVAPVAASSPAAAPAAGPVATPAVTPTPPAAQPVVDPLLSPAPTPAPLRPTAVAHPSHHANLLHRLLGHLRAFFSALFGTTRGTRPARPARR